jgi:2-phosphosulfolactate phosphatase
MEIRVDSLIEGACRAEGTAIIVDVYRAFTTAAVAFSRGAQQIILVPEIEEALELRDRGVGELCIGEVGGVRPDGFDFGNSPYELSRADVRGRILIQSTRAGTVGVASARRAGRVYVGSLAIAAATARAVLKAAPQLVTIVAMGWEGKIRTDEDELCAWYIKNLLEGRRPDREAIAALVQVGEHSQKFDDPAQPQYHPQDREIALDVDSVGLAIRVDLKDGLLVASAEALEAPARDRQP